MLVDLDHLSADDLTHLAGIKRERERRHAEECAAWLGDLMWRPTIGAYRSCPLISLARKGR
jgi:hypothetical protein